jgi:phage terminase small subunit
MTPKQQKFVAAYLGEAKGNGTQAAIIAGYSPKTARVIAQECLLKPAVAQAIAEAQAASLKASEVAIERWRKELERLAFSDPRQLFTQGGSLLTPVDLDEDTAASLKEFEVVERSIKNADGEYEIERVRKVKMHSKVKALELMGRHFGWLVGETMAVQVNVAQFVGGPPRETREEWVARKERESQARLAGPGVTDERPR